MAREYDAPRRREQAEQTRHDVLAAARSLFTERGWGQTTMRDIAREARVSEPTAYKAYGGKVGLAVALIDTIDVPADVPRMMAEMEEAGGDPYRQLAALVSYDRRLFERCGDVLQLIREAGRTEPELAAAYQRGRGRGAHNWRRIFTSWPAAAFADGVDVDSAVDTYAAICNVDVYDTLIEERDWRPEQVERWWHRSLCRLLLS